MLANKVDKKKKTTKNKPGNNDTGERKYRLFLKGNQRRPEGLITGI
jgi:hypothetical protein